jgi:Cu-Zn family superoxide dismutase
VRRAQWADARQAAARAVSTVPASSAVEVGHAAVDILFAADGRRESVGLLEGLVDRFPGEPGIQALLGETQLALGDAAGAARTGEAMTRAIPGDPRGWLVRGHAAWLDRQATPALDAFRKATEVAPRAIFAWTTLADALHQVEGHFAAHRDSRPVLLRALAVNPGNAEIEARLAEMDWEDDKPVEALARHRRVLQATPAHGPSLLALGRAAASRPDGRSEAQAWLVRARAGGAATAPVAAHLEAAIALAGGNPALARGLLADRVRQEPLDAVATLDLALALDAIGEAGAAADAANRALQLGLFSSDATQARALLARISGDRTVEVRVALIGGGPIGTLRLADTAAGLRINADLRGLPAGALGFHVHDIPDCSAAGHAAHAGHGGHAGHAGHAGHGAHRAGPHFNGSLGPPVAAPGHIAHAVGDLPPLQVGAGGTTQATVLAGRLRLDMIQQRAVLIHAGPDGMFGDSAPALACGIVPAK